MSKAVLLIGIMAFSWGLMKLVLDFYDILDSTLSIFAMLAGIAILQEQGQLDLKNRHLHKGLLGMAASFVSVFLFSDYVLNDGSRYFCPPYLGAACHQELLQPFVNGDFTAGILMSSLLCGLVLLSFGLMLRR